MQEINTWPGGEWQTVRKIGQGSYGTVYEIERKEKTRIYKAALKVIRIPSNESEISELLASGMNPQEIEAYFSDMVDHFINEYDLLSNLKGFTNIVSYEDHKIIRHEDNLYTTLLIRMELLTPLKEQIKAGPLSEESILKLGIDISSALEICHSQNILHRDIKTDNIFINRHGDYKLGDFGIARFVDDASAYMTSAGTIRYMSPEVYFRKPCSQNIDIYSLGLVLYELLNNGRGPFFPTDRPLLSSDRHTANLKRMTEKDIPAPQNGSPLLKKAILKAIALEPEDRFQTAADFKAALMYCASKLREKQSLHEEDPEDDGDAKTVCLSPTSTNWGDEPEIPTEPYDVQKDPSKERRNPPEKRKDPPASVPKRKKNPVVLAALPVLALFLVFGLLFFTRKKPDISDGSEMLTAQVPDPIKEEPSPAEEAPAPVTEEPSPAEEAPAPVTEEPSPAEEAPAPVTEEPSPAEEIPEPAAQRPQTHRMICSWNQNAEWNEENGRLLSVFGNSAYRREEIRSLTFVPTLEQANETAWDLSEMQDKSVLCWVVPNGEMYDLYIGSDQMIEASVNCKLLFAGLENLETIDFGDWFYTGSVQSMRGMFNGCKALRSVDLSSFDCHQVTTTGWMFFRCNSLTDIHLPAFDSGSLTEVIGMFSDCSVLEEVDLSGLRTDHVTSFKSMFANCSRLLSVDLSSFNTSSLTNVDRMFSGCSSLEKLNTDEWDITHITSAVSVYDGSTALPDSMKIDFPAASASE